jgi:SP family general alpha glucoside:H+ symporter-like MFS transporter
MGKSRSLACLLTSINSLTGDQHWGAKSAFFYAGTCFCCFVWAFFRLPEPKGRTYAEMDILFETRVSARKFKDTVVDSFHTVETDNDYGSEKKGVSAHLETVDSRDAV